MKNTVDTINRIKIFANYISVKRLTSIIYKELLKFNNNKKPNNSIQKRTSIELPAP